MKKIILLPVILFALSFTGKTQVVISDPVMTFYLQTNYPTCMTGNILDTSCTAVTSETVLDLSGVFCNDITGIQYFDGLQTLYTHNNYISFIPPLPATLKNLYCHDNPLLELPPLPPSLLQLSVVDCPNLFELPQLPFGLTLFTCVNTSILCMPHLPSSISAISVSDNPFTCLQNHIPAMNAALMSIPLCSFSATSINPYGCPSAFGIIGNIYLDVNSDCVMNVGDAGVKNFRVKLYNGSGSLIQQTYSMPGGAFELSSPGAGLYTVKVDTSGLPFDVPCAYPGNDTLVTLSPTDSLVSGFNFSFACTAGFDIGTFSAVRMGAVFPGINHQLKIFAGSLPTSYASDCGLLATNGQVIVTVSVNVSFVSAIPGALTPFVSGNVLTYDIPDFSAVNINNDFGIILKTANSAQSGDTVSVNVVVTPSAGDFDDTNNVFDYKYTIGNSYDPNMKEVFPVDVQLGYEDWFTYTIHFQNTGTAPAHNIRIADLLDTHLDPETFQVTAYSHQCKLLMHGNAAEFYFTNIMLPDSTTSPDGSKGFIQYKIKPKPGQLSGTKILNTAHIFFDYNEPIITNTTVNTFLSPEGILSNNTTTSIFTYPNPFSDVIAISAPGSPISQISVFNIFGEKIYSDFTSNEHHNIPAKGWNSGIYFVEIKTEAGGIFMKKVLKQ